MPHRVLVIDDELSIRLALQMALEDAAFEVDTVGTAEEALELRGVRRYDLLLVDKDLPGMNGIELIRRLRADGDQVPVIVITGYASRASAIDALNLGVDAYLEKPFEHIHQVVRLVDSTLRRQRPSATAAVARVWRALGGRREAPLRILVAASRAELRAAAIAALDGVNGEVAEGASVAETLGIAGSEVPDVVILDSSLDSDVGDLVEDLQARAPRAAFLIADAGLTLPAIERLTKLGAKAILTEPPGSEAWRRTLLEQLARVAAGRNA
jgi:DNA-binding NtrC family response regulator